MAFIIGKTRFQTTQMTPTVDVPEFWRGRLSLIPELVTPTHVAIDSAPMQPCNGAESMVVHLNGVKTSIMKRINKTNQFQNDATIIYGLNKFKECFVFNISQDLPCGGDQFKTHFTTARPPKP